jgi:hypothetical protein
MIKNKNRTLQKWSLGKGNHQTNFAIGKKPEADEEVEVMKIFRLYVLFLFLVLIRHINSYNSKKMSFPVFKDFDKHAAGSFEIKKFSYGLI